MDNVHFQPLDLVDGFEQITTVVIYEKVVNFLNSVNDTSPAIEIGSNNTDRKEAATIDFNGNENEEI